MNQIVAGPEIATFLSQVKSTAEIRDPQGKVLGHFAPAPAARTQNVSLPLRADPNKKYSLKEVYEHLLLITPDEARKDILRKKLAEWANQ